MHPLLSPGGRRSRYDLFSLRYAFVVGKLLCLLIAFSFSCTEPELNVSPTTIVDEENSTENAKINAACGCTYVVPANIHRIDGNVLGIKPGDVICLSSSINYLNLLFVNLTGTPSKPIIIKNCGGTVNLKPFGRTFALKTQNSKHFRITGTGSSATYGIRITGTSLGVTLDYLSTNFEVDHIEVYNVNFAGIMAKTDPSCDILTSRGKFTMKDIKIHDNYVHDTGGEAFYIGNSFFLNGVITPCGLRLPHEIHRVEIYNNKVKNSGWEGIQLGSATVGASVHDNTVENYGWKNIANQRNGIQIGEGTGGQCFNNLIHTGVGHGIVVLGLGDNVIHDNIIVNAGFSGIFCDERYTPGPGFKFLNNTIINPKIDGIRIYADLVPLNSIYNNIIVNPGSYGTYPYPRTGQDSYVYKLSKNVKLQMSNNRFTRNIAHMKFVSPSKNNYRLLAGSPAIDQGKNIKAYNITKDFYQGARLKGNVYDVGACEY
ncbi:right-handed parallel beta-helix repeat-containing protein [Pseudochryseolinea flava]|nr:right-handed parallel beta-helix repeat-containing protein [Pseudochryseolinea flava]